MSDDRLAVIAQLQRLGKKPSADTERSLHFVPIGAATFGNMYPLFRVIGREGDSTTVTLIVVSARQGHLRIIIKDAPRATVEWRKGRPQVFGANALYPSVVKDFYTRTVATADEVGTLLRQLSSVQSLP